MSLGNHFIKLIKSRIQRNLLDPDQRVIILDRTIKDFGKKLEANENPNARSEAFALLDQLANEYEAHHLDVLEIFQKGYERHPNDTQLLRAIVGLFRARDAQDKEAVQYYRALSDIEPNNIPLLSFLVQCYKKTQEIFPLMMAYERIVKQYKEYMEKQKDKEEDNVLESGIYLPIHQNAIMGLGEIYANMGRMDDEAISIYRESFKTEEEINGTVLKMLTMFYAQKGDKSPEALDTYEIYLAYDPGDWKMKVLLAQGYLAKNRDEEGLSILQNLHQEDSSNEEVLNLIIDYYRSHNIIDENSLPYYKTYYERHNQDNQILAMVARYYSIQNLLNEDAVEIYRKYLGILEQGSPERMEVLRLLGRYHLNNKKWSDAIRIYEEIRSQDQSSKDPVIPLATAYSEYDRTDEQALKIYQEALHQGTRNEKIHNLLCKYLYDTGKRGPMVVKTFKDSLNLHSKNQYARLGLCQYFHFSSDYKEGLREAIRYIRFYPEDKRGIELASKCLAQIDSKAGVDQLEDLEESIRIQILEDAFKFNPKSRTIALILFDVYLKSGRMDEQAEKVYLTVIPYKRDNLELLTLLSQYYLRQGDAARAFHYDNEIFNMLKVKCPIYINSETTADPLKKCPKICVSLVRYLLSNNIQHPDFGNILRCAYREGESSPKVIRNLASLYLKDQIYTPEALEIYQALLILEPNHPEARDMVMRSQMDKGNVEPILRHCEEGLHLNPMDELAIDLLVKCLSTNHVTDERITYFLEKLHHRYPQNEKISLALALLYSAQNNYSMATLSIYSSALHTRPDDIHLLTGLARCYESSENFDHAAIVYEQILGSIPDDSTIISRLAQNYRKMGLDNSHAQKIMQQAIELDPFDKDMVFYLSDLYLKKGETARGLQIIDNFLKTQTKDIDTIIEHLENMKGTPYWKPELHIKIGYLYIDKECYDEALNQFSYLSTNYSKYCGDLMEGYNRIIQKEPNYLRARIERGVILKIMGNYEDAIEDFETSSSIAANNPNVMYELAECYSAYAAHLRNPSNELLAKMGHLYYELEEYEKCIEAYQQLLRQDRKSREAILYIGKAFQKNNEHELALQYFIRLEMSDEVKDLLYELGDDFYTKGDVDKAIEAYNQIMAADITYRDAALKIGELRGELMDGSSLRRRRDIIMQQLSQKAQQRFELIEEVGRGTMGVVFKAYDKDLDEIVALKILSERFSEDEDAQERFRMEVKSARRLSHPNIIRIHDLGEEAGRKYISMEYVDGGDLKKLLTAQKQIPINRAIEYTYQLASALFAAHQMGIIHRDIKPANILMTSEKVCKLTDFGIATIIKESHNLSPDIIVGTPLYMSPEQNEGKSLGPGSDIYSLGVVIYEMLSGSPPFKIGNIAYHHIFTKPPQMKGVDKDMEELVMKCLEKKPSGRFPDMKGIMDILDGLRKKFPL
jgi:tetratricopeptide (TPR) repeat protein